MKPLAVSPATSFRIFDVLRGLGAETVPLKPSSRAARISSRRVGRRHAREHDQVGLAPTTFDITGKKSVVPGS